ncbi:MAG: type II secretion system F family protein [Candidatus Wildermuthbacteria bacterium]|nr:type II secretion system F family protein [Candidatus Wildermuthbacteria bacterium]
MPTYFYTATSLQGEKITGSENAKSERDLARSLHEKGFVLTKVASGKEAGAKRTLLQLFEGLFSVPLSEKLLFMRNLKVMVQAGVPLPKALDILSLQTGSKQLRHAIEDMKEKVMQGETLSLAMSRHSTIFSDLFLNMIKAGEESGTMEGVLSHLTLQLEREHDLKSKIQGALMYPAVVVVAMIGVGIIMLVSVVPNLARTFNELGVTLPATTRFVIGLGEFLSHQWYIALLVFLVVALALWRALKSAKGKWLVDGFMLHVPLFSPLIQKINSAFFARTLSSLIGAGIPIVKSLEITSTVLNNGRFRKALENAAEEVRKGAKLSQSLKSSGKLYPLVVLQMLEVGEETGQTGEVLGKLADFFEEEVNAITKNMASVIEPVLMLFMGGLVGFFAVSMIQPMYSILGAVK